MAGNVTGDDRGGPTGFDQDFAGLGSLGIPNSPHNAVSDKAGFFMSYTMLVGFIVKFLNPGTAGSHAQNELELEAWQRKSEKCVCFLGVF